MLILASKVLWFEESVCWDESACENLGNDRSNQEKNQYWTVCWKNGSPLLGVTWIRMETSEDDQPKSP